MVNTILTMSMMKRTSNHGSKRICIRNRRLHIILNKPSRFMLDGEIYDSVNEIIYSVIPEKLSILTGCYEIRSSL